MHDTVVKIGDIIFLAILKMGHYTHFLHNVKILCLTDVIKISTLLHSADLELKFNDSVKVV